MNGQMWRNDDNNLNPEGVAANVDLMQNHGLVCKINKGLGEAESQRPKAGAEAPNENERLHGEALAPLPPQIPDRHTFINQM
jgi:hypothetical protein